MSLKVTLGFLHESPLLNLVCTVMELLVLASVTAVLCAAAWLFVRRPFQRLPLPPGPKSHPVIGSVFQMPVTYQWLTFDKWIKEYGKLTSHSFCNSNTEFHPQATSCTPRFWEINSSYLGQQSGPMTFLSNDLLYIPTECYCL